VYVRKLPPEEVPSISSVIIGFRDQYIGRVPMRYIRKGLKGTAAYVGKAIDLPNACVRAKIHALSDSSGKVLGVLPSPLTISRLLRVSLRESTIRSFVQKLQK
jgi:hypothetical protein